IILSYFTLVLGELVPKRIAMKKPDEVARAACGIIRAVAFVMKPVIWLLSVSTNGMLRLFHIDPDEDNEKVTEEEIRLMVDAGEEKGTIESNEKEMIENIFEFNNITAADVMTHRTEMTAFWIGDETDFIVQTINESGFSRFPVYDEDIDNIIGILSTRKFLLNLQSPEPLPLKDLLYEPYLVPENVRADVLFRDMQKNKIHLAVVLDEYGGTSGIVTMEDLIEEIVGNIYDESDVAEESDFIKLSDNLWRVAGSVELERIEKELDVNFEEEDDEYDTLSGLIFSKFTVIPGDGETPELDVPFLHVKVESIADHRVEWALISKLPDKIEDEEDTEKEEKSKDNS
ncbi:MAG: hemolysin family protein, partial [Firmicutes bacterium]|nr:hemolysin family protein [Bacillota bacterium]